MLPVCDQEVGTTCATALFQARLQSGPLFGLNVVELTNAVNISLNSHIAMRQVRVAIFLTGRDSLLQMRLGTLCFRLYLQRKALPAPPQFSRERWVSSIKCPVSLIGSVSVRRQRRASLQTSRHTSSTIPRNITRRVLYWGHSKPERKWRKESIVSVEIATDEVGYTILGSDEEKWAPKTKETADHSLPFIVGMVLLEGKIQNSSYSQRNLVNPEIINFLKKITVREDRDLTSSYHPRLQTE